MSSKINKLLLIVLVFVLFSIQPIFANEIPIISADGDMLIEAIEKNDEAKVDELLLKKINPNSRGHKNKYMSPLRMAARNKSSMHIVESLIKHGADVKEKGIICFSLWNADIAGLLIANGAEIRGPICAGDSPMHAATYIESLESAELLLKHGADINNQDNMCRRSPLQNAAFHGKAQSVKWLIEHHANVNLTDCRGQTAITLGASYKANTEIFNMLLDGGANLSPQELPEITLGACRAGNMEALEFLSHRGVNIDFNACYTALAYSSSPNQNLLKWLASRSTIRNTKIGKESMLHIAVENNNLELAKLLIDSGADVNSKGDLDRPPLDGAILSNRFSTKLNFNKEMIKLLASHGADFNVKYGRQKRTILHALADTPSIDADHLEWESFCKKRVEAAEEIIKYGADVNIRDEIGNSPLHIAAYTNNILMINMLILHGANLNIVNNMGQTPLYYSISIRDWVDISRELFTIWTLSTLEANAGVKQDWAGLKVIASEAYNPTKKEQLLKFLNQLEKNPSSIFQRKNLEKAIEKIIDDAPKSQQDRLASCDPRIAISAAREIINNIDTLSEPLLLFPPARALFQHGKKDDAVFWFYAAQLRTRYQLVFEKGDRGQLLTIMIMVIGAPINNYALQDAVNLNRILDRVLEWDKNTPNPFRDKARSKSDGQQIEQVYSGFRDLKAKLVSERNDLEQQARLAAPQVQQALDAEFANRCRKSTGGAP